MLPRILVGAALLRGPVVHLKQPQACVCERAVPVLRAEGAKKEKEKNEEEKEQKEGTEYTLLTFFSSTLERCRF